MAIQTQCQQCQKQHRFRDENTGKKFKCKACGSINQVSSPGKAESKDEFLDGLDDAVKMASEANSLPKRKASRTTPQVSKKRRQNEQFPQRQGQRKNKANRLDEILGYSLVANALCVFGLIVLIPALWMIEDYELGAIPSFVFVSLKSLFAAGVLGMVISSLIVRMKKYSCRACRKGKLFPIAREEDGIEYVRNSDGGYNTKKVSQYYDCDRCSHRVWIEH